MNKKFFTYFHQLPVEVDLRLGVTNNHTEQVPLVLQLAVLLFGLGTIVVETKHNLAGSVDVGVVKVWSIVILLDW